MSTAWQLWSRLSDRSPECWKSRFRSRPERQPFCRTNWKRFRPPAAGTLPPPLASGAEVFPRPRLGAWVRTTSERGRVDRRRNHGRPKPRLLLRPLILRPLIHPVVHGFVPELRILRLQHPVAFVGEIEHL